MPQPRRGRERWAVMLNRSGVYRHVGVEHGDAARERGLNYPHFFFNLFIAARDDETWWVFWLLYCNGVGLRKRKVVEGCSGKAGTNFSSGTPPANAPTRQERLAALRTVGSLALDLARHVVAISARNPVLAKPDATRVA